ncbi:MAG: tetratricopeptide repeat protein [Gammaproteobacteria bacterium]
MNSKHEDKTREEPPRIKPANITLTPATGSDKSVPSRVKSWRPFLIGAGLCVLLIFMLVVIFLLPDWSAPPATTATKAPLQSNTTGSHSVTAAPATAGRQAESPWTEAQLAKLRKESQEILSRMLEAQRALEKRSVQQWADKEYTQAMDLAKSGDAAYREREFEQAKEQYQLALDGFNALLDRIDTYFREAMERGNQAIDEGDSKTAEEAFQRALLLKPGAPLAIRGSKRAETLDEVLALTTKGNDYLRNGQLDDAKKSYQQALSLDRYAKQAANQLKIVKQKIIDREFTRAMSRGYVALEHDELKQARKAFMQAMKIKPGATEAQSALHQTKTRITSRKINALLTSARQLEQEERWSQAIVIYDQALALDANLASAQQGKRYASWRAGLNKRLLVTIAKPERLSNKAVFNEAKALLDEARSVARPGAELKKQMTYLARLLTQAITPVRVTFHSNERTEVNLYKVGVLGQFKEKELSLRPGHYVAVGKREGYRDVRVEFDVNSNKPMQPVIVQCKETVL